MRDNIGLLRLRLEVDKFRILLYYLQCWLFKKGWYKISKIKFPLKWHISKKDRVLCKERSKGSNIVLIGVCLNSGHLMGGSHYGGDYYEPYMIAMRLDKKRAYFPIPPNAQTTIYAVIMDNADLKAFKLNDEIKKDNGLKTNTIPMIIRPFQIVGLKAAIERPCAGPGFDFDSRIDFSGPYYDKLIKAWK